jgi:hypothetical protein
MAKRKATAKRRKRRRTNDGEKWMQAAFSKRPGQLHRDLGIPEGQKIPLEMLRQAAKRKGKVGLRARAALIGRKIAEKR